jgi:hypothetical protein
MSRASIYLSCIIAVFITSIASACYISECTGAYTIQTWSFNTLTNPAIPESYDNIYGTPSAEMSTPQTPPDYFRWMDVVDGRQGVWIGDPLEITLTIPNQQLPNEYKEIWLEMDFQAALDWINVKPNPLEASVVEVIYGDISPIENTQWSKLIIGWRIYPNPFEETICMSITGTGGMVDYITVETCCIPEPATITLFSLGTLVLLTRKRK